VAHLPKEYDEKVFAKTETLLKCLYYIVCYLHKTLKSSHPPFYFHLLIHFFGWFVQKNGTCCKSCNLCLLSFLGLPTSWIVFPLFPFLRCLRKRVYAVFHYVARRCWNCVSYIRANYSFTFCCFKWHYKAPISFPFLLLQDEKPKLFVSQSVSNCSLTFCCFNWQRPVFPNLLQIVIVTFTKLVGYLGS
jgi:hypothetical protein